MKKNIIFTCNTISEYQREIAILKKQILKEGKNSKIHGTTRGSWLKQLIQELKAAKELKKIGEFR